MKASRYMVYKDLVLCQKTDCRDSFLPASQTVQAEGAQPSGPDQEIPLQFPSRLRIQRAQKHLSVCLDSPKEQFFFPGI